MISTQDYATPSLNSHFLWKIPENKEMIDASELDAL